jgi:AcrR family transcriptional regulator
MATLTRSARTGGRASRRTAEERREEVLRAALAEFAVHGLDGTSTEAIARRIGISQPYIFRLFPTKKDLFLAAIDQCFDRVSAAFRAAAENPEQAADLSHHLGASRIGKRLHAMGHAYARLLARRELLLFQMQAYAACGDEQVRRKVKQRWEELAKLTAELSGASPDELTLYLARGMLLNVVAAIGLVPDKASDRWAHEAIGLA